MSTGSTPKPTSLDEVFVEAYRSYLRSLRDGLANLDIDALDLSGVRAPSSSASGSAVPGAALTLGGFTYAVVPPIGGFTYSGVPVMGGFTYSGIPTLGGFTYAGSPPAAAADVSQASAPASDDKPS